MDNFQIANTFSLLAKIMDIHGENSFKSRTYANAAFQIEKLPAPLKNLDPAVISTIKGIGDATGKKIMELVNTGKLLLLEKYLSETPPGVLEMMKIKGIGSKKINIIWKEMEIESVGELLYACNENRLSRYKGFGPKTELNIKESIEFFLSKQGFFLYKDAIPFNDSLIKIFSEKFPSNVIFTSGDFRRRTVIIENLTFITDINPRAIRDNLDLQPGFHFLIEENDVLTYQLENGPVAKIYSCPGGNLLETFFLTTGSTTFINAFQQHYPAIFSRLAEINDENSLFEKAGLPFIPPFLREHAGIISAAKDHTITGLIEEPDIKGIIHSHSTWSDGKHTLKQMANIARSEGFEYLVITDHSKSASYANGLNTDRIIQQHLEINELNKELAPFKIFKSIESDILPDGSLDYPNEVLATFDLVIASVHSGLKMAEEKATARLITAIENPFTTILGHMTGRLLLSRNGYPVDHKKIIDACAANGVVIELNANPRRLDLDWTWIPYAISKKVLISINPDAHSTESFRDIKYGVLAAQKGMLTANQNLSSFSLENFETFLAARKKG